MTTLAGIIVSALATAAAGLVAVKVCKNEQRRAAESDVERKEKKMKDEIIDLNDAIFERKDEKVNEKVAKLLSVLALCLSCAACASKQPEVIHYIAADRRITSITNESGVACKAVPDVVFAEMCEKLVELKALKKEKEVDKRVGQ